MVDKCSVDECDRPRQGRKPYCSMHYRRWQKHGDPLKLGYMRRDQETCQVEGCEKPITARLYCGGHYQRWHTGAQIEGALRPRNAPTATGKVCSKCGQTKLLTDFSPNGAGTITAWCKPCRRYALKHRHYGLEPEAYDAMVKNGCEACGTTTRRIDIDHDHISGEVRGALCTSCNLTLGHMNDDPKRLQALIDYLSAHATKRAT